MMASPPEDASGAAIGMQAKARQLKTLTRTVTDNSLK